MSSSSDTRLIDFAQARVNRIADSIDNLAEQIKRTNTHVERLYRDMGELKSEMGELRSELGGLRAEMRAGFARIDHELRDTRSEVILQANQIINAQQQNFRALMRLDEIEQRPDEPKP